MAWQAQTRMGGVFLWLALVSATAVGSAVPQLSVTVVGCGQTTSGEEATCLVKLAELEQCLSQAVKPADDGPVSSTVDSQALYARTAKALASCPAFVTYFWENEPFAIKVEVEGFSLKPVVTRSGLISAAVRRRVVGGHNNFFVDPRVSRGLVRMSPQFVLLFPLILSVTKVGHAILLFQESSFMAGTHNMKGLVSVPLSATNISTRLNSATWVTACAEAVHRRVAQVTAAFEQSFGQWCNYLFRPNVSPAISYICRLL